MKKLLVILTVLWFAKPSAAQDTISLLLRTRGDKMLRTIEAEKDPQKRHELILDLLSIGSDSDPIYTLQLARQLYETGEKNNDAVAKATAWSYYGQGYRLSGNYVKALEFHSKAIQLALKTGNNSVIGQAYNQIAHIYKDREEFEQAIQLYQTAGMYAEQGSSELPKIWPIMNLGAVYLGTGKLDSSLYYSRKAYTKMLSHDFQSGNQYLPYILGNIGGAYSAMKKESEALDTFRVALAIVQNPNFTHLRQKQILYARIADHFKNYGQLDSCLLYSKLAINTVENTLFSFLNTKPARTLSELYEKKNSDSAVKYLKLFLKTNEVINSTRVTQQLQMMSFEESQRNMELEQARKNYRSRVQIFLLLGGLLILMIISSLMFRNNKQKQRANQLLHRQKKELETALQKLSSTQQQLVQSEKMASLGELTAGIAHEIQNPLNFVNNFAEVNRELAVELKDAVEKGDLQEIKSLANDIADNEEKILNHGRRADAIVKSMLQHSQTSSNVKEATDINALCEEYLRLSYHARMNALAGQGSRAKESFNARFETHFDESIGQVNVMPQEMGRVLLNLINNAFYAVSEKQKTAGEGYTPLVSISTRMLGDKIEISITDNGTGMPDKVKEKIFQPFFTTKPTGEGTGLGLSLSYDIVTKGHSGKLEVQSTEGEGTMFTISLPAQQ